MAADYIACSVNMSAMVLDFDINLWSFMSSHLSTIELWLGKIQDASSLISIKGKHIIASNTNIHSIGPNGFEFDLSGWVEKVFQKY